MMRVALYARVSTHRQAQAQTIDQQLERLYQQAHARGWQLHPDHVFRDDGDSGATLTRPGLDRLRDKVAAAEVDRILLTAPDRLARKYVHQVLLVDELQRFGAEVEFLDRPMSRNDPHDQLLLQIRGAVAEYERTLIAERMRRGRQMKLQAGLLLPWSRAPFGYQVDPAHPRDPVGVRMDEAAAAVVAEIFAWYAEEQTTLRAVIKRLQARAIESPSGKPRWTIATVRNILKNPTYIGVVYAGRMHTRPVSRRRSPTQPVRQPPREAKIDVGREHWIEVARIPAIIGQEEFDLVQAKLAQNIQYAGRNNTAHAYLLRSMVSCGLCRMACIGRFIKPHNGYYVCRAKRLPIDSGCDEQCTARWVPSGQLDELVWQDLCEVMTHPAMIEQALARALGGGWLPQQMQARRELLYQGQASLRRQLERLTEAYLSGVIALLEYQRRRVELEQKAAALEQQEQQVVAQADRQAEVAGMAVSVRDFSARVQCSLATAGFEQKRQLVELLIDRVVVTDEQVEIRYVIPTSRSSEKVRFSHLRSDYQSHLQVARHCVQRP